MTPAAFAIPGDIETKTGGFIYERNVLYALREAGREVEHLQLPANFPDPTAAETEAAAQAMAAVPADRPLIVDGLVYGGIATAALARVRAPLVAMIHHPLALETGLPEARARALFVQERDNLALAAEVVVPSPHTARLLVDEYGVPEDRVWIALPGFQPGDPRREPVDPPLIFAAGILVPRKGHDILLHALKRIEHLPWRAVIAGAAHFPETAAELKVMKRLLKLEKRVTFAGLVTGEALDRLFRQATVFALATRFEGYGMVFGEALLHGLPIVSCATGAVPETVPAEAGLLVPPDDPEAFAAALEQVLTDTDLRGRMAAAATAAGQLLPRWADTAAVMAQAVDRAATR